MAEQLRTLNDITVENEFHRTKFSVRNGYTELIDKSKLRDEAKKWIKELKCETVIISNG